MSRKTPTYLILVAVMTLIFLTAGIATAAPVTQSITYQGKLTNAAGTPLTGTYSVIFKIYDASSGGTALSTDMHSVTATNGLFTTPIAITDPTLVDGRGLWLGIKVGSDPEMTPRQEIRPVPYALSLKPGAVITGDAGANPSLKVVNTGNNVAALIAGTTGTNSPALFASALGVSSPAVYASSPNDIGVYGSGKTGAFFTTNQGGPSWDSPQKAVNVSARFDNTSGVWVTSSGDFSQGVFANTSGDYDGGLGAATFGDYGTAISGYTFGTTSTGLDVSTSGYASRGVLSRTSGDISDGIFLQTNGQESHGVEAHTYGNDSRGVYGYTEGNRSDGVFGYVWGVDSRGVYGESYRDIGVYGIGKEGGYFTTNQAGTAWNNLRPGLNVSTVYDYNPGILVNTSGYESDGMSVYTSGIYSPGIFAFTTADHSVSYDARTDGDQSQGVYAQTLGYNSNGVEADTSGDYSNGIDAFTTGSNSNGVFAETIGTGSDGVHAEAYGSNSRGVFGHSYNNEGVWGESIMKAGVAGCSTQKAGLWGMSENDVGVYATTDRADHKYGVYTPDYIYAKGSQYPAVDIAEYMRVTGDDPPGTVLVIGTGGKLLPSSAAYDTRVAGIVSTNPAVSLGAMDTGNPGEAPVAVAGRVPCRVDAGYGPIHEGDLLSTSDTPGYAMKAQPVDIGGMQIYRPGTVLGKSMGTLESGTGTIEVLVTLQ
jgi:hypothetical protein